MAQQFSYLAESSAVENGLTNGQKDFRQQMLDSNLFVSCKSIALDNFQNYLSGNNATLTIPGIMGSYTVAESREEISPNQYLDYLWFGKIQNEYPGYFMIVEKDGLTAGYIQTADKFYTIVPLSSGKAFLFEANLEKFNRYVCGNERFGIPDPHHSSVKPCEIENNTCIVTIDVLVLVTPESQAFFQSLANPFIATIFAVLGLESMNFAIDNSDIPNKRIRYSFEEISFAFDASIDIGLDIDALATNNAAQNLRQLYRADMVVMLTNQGYTGQGGGGIFGVVADIGPTFDGSYMIVEAPSMFGPRLTLAHEMGHLFGARHNRSSNVPCNNCIGSDDTDVCSHGFRFTDINNTDQFTLMALLVGQTRIMHFSNPNVQFNGAATGNNDNDNARTIRNTGCAINSYFPDATFGADISTASPCGQTGTFTVSAIVKEATPAFPGHPPYTYSWSATGGLGAGLSNVQPNGSSCAIGYYCFSNIGSGAHVIVTLTVSSADGGTATFAKNIYISSCLTGADDRNNDITKEEDDRATIPTLLPYPNPVSNTLFVVNPTSDIDCKVEIVNLGGKIQSVEQKNDDNLIKLNVTHLSDGIYFLKMKTADGINTAKFIKSNN